MNKGWALKISLDVEISHATCQNCRIVLVEADGETYSALEAAEETAATRMGATEISNSWGGREPSVDSNVFDQPGIAITTAAGDYGYRNWDGRYEEEKRYVDYPAASPHVVAVGGTRLSLTAQGAWAGEAVWNDGSTIDGGAGAGGGGCSERFLAAAWQLGLTNWSTVGCESERAVADVAADADPYTGAAVYDSTPIEGSKGWRSIGGTSLASPLIASVFALAGGAVGVEYPASTLYENETKAPGSLHDISSGSNGECRKSFDRETGVSGCTALEEAQLSCGEQAICLAGPGYDGPSGIGTPDGVGAFAPVGPTGKGTQQIEFSSTPPSSAMVGGPAYTVAATASSGLPVSFSSATPSVCLVADAIVRMLATGLCTIDAHQLGNSEYEPAPQVQQSFTVARDSQTITFTSSPPPPESVRSSYREVHATASSGLSVSFRSETPSVCEVRFYTETGAEIEYRAAGTCTLDAVQAGNESFEPAPEVRQSFTVPGLAQIIQWISNPPSSATLKGPVYEVEATATSGLAVSFSSATPAVCVVEPSNFSFRAIVTYTAAGTCVVDADQAGDAEYAPAHQMQQSIPVSKRAQRIEFISTAPTSGASDGETYVTSVAASSGLPVSLASATPSVCTLAGSTVSFIAAGICTLTANQAGNAEFASAAEVQQSFAVGKRVQDIAFISSAPMSAAIGGAAYLVSASTSSGLPVSLASATPSVCTLAGSTVSFVGAGTCTLTASQAGNADFASAPEVQQSFAVARRSQRIAFDSRAPEAATVAGTPYAVSAAATSALPITFTSATPSVCVVAGSTVGFIAAGTCTIDVDQLGDSEYAPATQAQQSFAVGAVLLPAYVPASVPILLAPPPAPPPPVGSFTVVGAPVVNARTGAIGFTVSVPSAGNVRWLLTFPLRDGLRRGVCRSRRRESGRDCRLARVVFARSSLAVPGARTVKFTVTPSHAASVALDRGAAVRVAASLTFEPTLGGTTTTQRRSISIEHNGSGFRLTGGRVKAQLSRAGVKVNVDGQTVTMTLAALGRGSHLSALPTVAPRVEGERVTFDRSGVSEWYRARTHGVEQGFTLARRPDGAHGPVTLALSLSGAFRAEGSRSQLDFQVGSQTALRASPLRYTGLAAHDARGRPLHVWLQLSGEQVLIHVNDAGARYPLVVDPLIQQGPTLTPPEGGFGDSVAMSADGTTALVGGRSGKGGSAWVFTRSGSIWTQQGERLTGAGEQPEGEFGWRVALSADGNTALVGAPAENGNVGGAWVFRRSGSTWTQQGPELTGAGETGAGRFGVSVALSADGNTALIGAEEDYNGSGAVWAFTRSGSTWTQDGPKLVPSDESESEQSFFGASVGLSASGETALIGGWGDANAQGAAWVFTRSGSTWAQQGKKLAPAGGKAWFGWSVALSEDGNTALIGAIAPVEEGAAWVFTRSGSTWTAEQKLTLVEGQRSYSELGYSVALTADGNTALIGAPDGSYENNGTAWVFTRSGQTWTRRNPRFAASRPKAQGVISARAWRSPRPARRRSLVAPGRHGRRRLSGKPQARRQPTSGLSRSARPVRHSGSKRRTRAMRRWRRSPSLAPLS